MDSNVLKLRLYDYLSLVTILKNQLIRTYLTSVCTVFIFLLFIGCSDEIKDSEKVKTKKPIRYDLNEIRTDGTLKALVDNSSTSYFVYRGNPMGYEYELLQEFTSSIGIELQVIPIKNLDGIVDSLIDFKGDIIAANLTITKDRAEKVEFSSSLLQSQQVLVQRIEDSNDSGVTFLESSVQLKGKRVYVRKQSSFFKRLLNLSEEIGGYIDVQEVAGNVTVEDLIEMVAIGEIDYTVADRHVARINSAYYSNLNTAVAVSLEQEVAWAVRKESTELLIAIDNWLREFKKTTKFRLIYLKYFGNTKSYNNRLKGDLFVSKSGMLSPYDDIIKRESQRINWDWRLLTSLIYQESQFKNDVSSWAGAKGVMQLMPETASEYGVDSSASVEENIKAGVSYILWIDEQFRDKITSPEERQKFVLSAYNVGLGHVFDAIRLAKKYNKNPEVWQANVDSMLLNKSKPLYYKDDLAFYGYCRGKEPYNYVKEIMKRYEHYVNLTEL